MSNEKKKKGLSPAAQALILTSAMMAEESDLSMGPLFKPKKERKPKYPFTEEEIEQMNAIEDFKEKKKFIKKLKEKYSGRRR